MMEKARQSNRRSVGFRISTSVLFLGILAACGYAAARQENRPTVGVPVAYTAMALADVQQDETLLDVRAKLKGEREQEIALLNSVIEHPDADSATRSDALAQKAQIASRMEREAQIEAVLLQMGIQGEAVCGEVGLTLIVRAEDMPDEQTKLRVMHAACAQTGMDASKMKIILVKK